MRWAPLPLVGGAYSDDAKPWSAQDTLNYIPVMAEKSGTRSEAMLRCLPGCSTVSILGTDAPIRGLHNAEGQLLAVSSNKLFRIGSDGTATDLGTIPGVARVSIAHNQITNGNEVAIATGTSGYIYNTTTGTVAQITDEGFPGAKVFDFLDGYLMYVEPQGRFWGWSDLANGTSYNTLDRAEAEAQPDKIVTGIVTHREWLVFGERSGEFYRNVGTTTGTFQRIDGAEMEVGCASQFGAAKLDNSVCFLGNDGIVYRLEGYQPRRISTHAIEQAISRCDLSRAFAMVYEDRGHKVFYLTFPDGKTWGYDVATQEWHRRASYGMDRWRMNALVRWGKEWIAGDVSNGSLYQLDWAVQNEAGAQMERRRVFPVLHDNQNRLTVNALELVFDTGLGAESSPIPTPLVPRPSITGSLPDGMVGEAMVPFAYRIRGGVPPYSVSVSSGTFPPGLSMNSAGVVTGVPTTTGTFSWGLRAVDATGAVATGNDSINVGAAYWVATTNGDTNGPYALSLGGLDWSAPLKYANVGSGNVMSLLSADATAINLYGSTQGRESGNLGTSWTNQIGGGSQSSAKATISNGVALVASNAGVVKRSTDRINFTEIATGDSLNLNAISATATRVLVAGYRCHSSANNGLTWTYNAGYPFSNLEQILALANDGTTFMAVGQNNRIAKTTDGSAFTTLTSPFAGTGAIKVVAYTAGVWVIANVAGQIAFSHDTGATWTVSAQTLGAAAACLAGYRGRFVLGGLSGKLLTSTDGDSWTAPTHNFSTSDITDVIGFTGTP